MKKTLIFTAAIVMAISVTAFSGCSMSSYYPTKNNSGTSPYASTQQKTTEPRRSYSGSVQTATEMWTEAPTEPPTEEWTEAPTESPTEPPTDSPTDIEAPRRFLTISDGDTINLSGTVTVEEDSSSPSFTTYHAILNLDTPFSCHLSGMCYDGTKMYYIDSVQIPEEYKDRVGEHVTVYGKVMTAHTAHHLRDMVIT